MSKIFDALKEAELANRSRRGLAATRDDSARAIFVVHAKDSVAPCGPAAKANQWLSRHGAARYLIGFLLGVMLTSAAEILLHHHASAVADHQRSLAIAPAGNVPGKPSPGSTVEQSLAALPVTLSPNLPGFVLQVATMKHEGNADALAETLREENFPAFVFEPATGSFYQVAIGVYGNADAAATVEGKLETQGFQPILRRWSPPDRQ